MITLHKKGLAKLKQMFSLTLVILVYCYAASEYVEGVLFIVKRLRRNATLASKFSNKHMCCLNSLSVAFRFTFFSICFTSFSTKKIKKHCFFIFPTMIWIKSSDGNHLFCANELEAPQCSQTLCRLTRDAFCTLFWDYCVCKNTVYCTSSLNCCTDIS